MRWRTSCLGTELWHPELAHDALVGQVPVGIQEVSLYYVMMWKVLLVYCRLELSIWSWSWIPDLFIFPAGMCWLPSKNTSLVFTSGIAGVPHVDLTYFGIYLNIFCFHFFLITFLAWEFSSAECTIVMMTMSDVLHTSLLMMNLKLVMLTRVKVSFFNLNIQYKIVTFGQKLFLTSWHFPPTETSLIGIKGLWIIAVILFEKFFYSFQFQLQYYEHQYIHLYHCVNKSVTLCKKNLISETDVPWLMNS